MTPKQTVLSSPMPEAEVLERWTGDPEIRPMLRESAGVVNGAASAYAWLSGWTGSAARWFR